MVSMKSKTLTLSIAAAVGAFLLMATPAEAKDKHHRKHHDNYRNNGDCYRGGGYYRPVQYYQPVQYYRPAPRYYAPQPFFSFVFGGGGRDCR